MKIYELLKDTISTLAESGIENAGFEARQILEHVGLSRMTIMTEPAAEISEDTARAALDIIRKRCSGYPLQYLLGEWEFYGLPFKVGEGVLIPRQDTETLVEVALGYLKTLPESKRTVLDLCSGSGCIGITLAKLANARVTLVEKSDSALKYLKENVKLNDVEGLCQVVQADVLDENADFGNFSVIASNPPYLTKAEMDSLQREVRHEPEMALFGGDDGLYFYRQLIPQYKKSLENGGLLAVEIGDSMAMASEVMEIFAQSGFSPETEIDSVDVQRVVYAFNKSI